MDEQLMPELPSRRDNPDVVGVSISTPDVDYILRPDVGASENDPPYTGSRLTDEGSEGRRSCDWIFRY